MLKDVAADALTGGGGGPSLDANVGQAKTEGDGSVAQQANTAVSVSGGKSETTYEAPIDSVTVNERMPWWMVIIVILLAGWAIPSPSEMVRGAISLVKNE